MLISGHAIHTLQTCPRKYVLERDYRYLPWFPSSLLSATLRQSILTLSNSTPATLPSIIQSALTQFTGNCVTPGLDVPPGTDTYKLSTDYTAIIRNVLTYLSTTALPKLALTHPSLIPNSPDYWQYLSFTDLSPTSPSLHRYIFPSSISDHARIRELHSWELYGDLTLSALPMTLHFISVGHREASHALTPWCRAFQSSITRQIRFQRKSGGSLNEKWNPVYFNRGSDSADWIEKMCADGVIKELVQSYSVQPPDQERVDRFKYELAHELERIHNLDSKVFTDLPLTRPMCDSPYTCQHQRVCYARDPEHELTLSGLYVPIKKPK